MKHVLLATLALTAFTAADESETEKEWKVLAKPSELGLSHAADTFLENALVPATLASEEKSELKRLKKLVAGESRPVSPADLLEIKKVRSIQIGQYGVFTYPYFSCRFKKTGSGVFFEKTSGSQRKSGPVFQNDDHTLVFLGASTVNNEPQRQYSGLTRSKDTSHDAAGLIIKRGKTFLALFPGKGNQWEVYEFR